MLSPLCATFHLVLLRHDVSDQLDSSSKNTLFPAFSTDFTILIIDTTVMSLDCKDKLNYKKEK